MVLGLILVVLGGYFAFAYLGRPSIIRHKFQVATFSLDAAGDPVVRLEYRDPEFSPGVRYLKGFWERSQPVVQYELEVFRHGKWLVYEPEMGRSRLQPRPSPRLYIEEMPVPTCKKWRFRVWSEEVKQVRWLQGFPRLRGLFATSKTTIWETDELPGWSMSNWRFQEATNQDGGTRVIVEEKR
jgi:hypothetical protein